ncbi:hypothetical protein GPECTOR_1g156 [Gonium pectorale]|uniref:Protein SYS1 homolog n=1 Tax=Gonium pectorale TaxID=33097 RepID=A0A150H249_GONPE|nr:hypothetical protein GPECTOR_1g156 [Gonium pectorale]|eukprot:KXZ56181.1 hypothetical protein GPECTOR_1g156 [Gonium pectorale]
MLYGAAVWDPVLIIAQIVTLQCLFYLSLGLWQGLLLGPSVGRLSIAHLFGWKLYSLGTYVGWMSVVSLLLTSVLGAVFLVWIVERAKKCLDFASTCFLFHFLFCWRHDGFPTRLEWWLANILGLVIMSLFGEWLCLRREMQEIPLNTLRGRGASAASGGAGGAGSSGTGGGAGSSVGTSSAVQMSSAAVSKAGPKGSVSQQAGGANNV